MPVAVILERECDLIHNRGFSTAGRHAVRANLKARGSVLPEKRRRGLRRSVRGTRSSDSVAASNRRTCRFHLTSKSQRIPDCCDAAVQSDLETDWRRETAWL
jgi:hypothetical protein